MNWHQKFAVLLFAGLAALSGHAQTAGKYLAPRDQLIAIRAGRLFDARSGMMLTNQAVIVRSDRIAEVPAAKMQGVFNWNDAVAGYPLSPRGQAHFIRDLVAWGVHTGLLSGIRPWAPDLAGPGWGPMSMFGRNGKIAVARPALGATHEAISAER